MAMNSSGSVPGSSPAFGINRSRDACYVLVAIVKKRLTLDASLYTMVQIFPLTLFEKMPIKQAFAGSDYQSEQDNDCINLSLFVF
jgi:hypothetical protein